MRIVLFGDIHVFRLLIAPWHLASKRLLGQSNLLLNRRKRFDHAQLPRLIDQAMALEPELCLLSGDLTTTALPAEFALVKRYLMPLSDRVPTVGVPGNHDRYTYASSRRKRIDRLLPEMIPRSFPHTRPLTDSWDLLALDAAAPHPYNARGRLGQVQLQAAERYIETRQADRGLVVLCHYPCALPGYIHEHASHALQERDALRGALERCAARVVYLHGHIHQPWHHEPGDGSGVPFTCIDAGAPCMIGRDEPLGQGFYHIDLPDDPADPIRVEHHTLASSEAGPTHPAAHH